MILDDFLEIIPGSVYKNSKPEKTLKFTFSVDVEKFSWKTYKVIYDL